LLQPSAKMAANFPVLSVPETNSLASDGGVPTQDDIDSTLEAPPYSPMTEASEPMQSEGSESHPSPSFIGSSHSGSYSKSTALHFFKLLTILTGFFGPRKKGTN